VNIKSFNHEAHEEHEGLEGEMVFGAVVLAKAGTQGASEIFWIPACAGMTRSTKHRLPPN